MHTWSWSFYRKGFVLPRYLKQRQHKSFSIYSPMELVLDLWLELKIKWNLSNPTHQGTRETCWIVQDVKVLRFNLVNWNLLEPIISVWGHRMSVNSGVGLHKFHCTNYVKNYPSNHFCVVYFQTVPTASVL